MPRSVHDTRSPNDIRSDIIERFPWAVQHNIRMVIGTDLDALLSAAFMHHHFEWEPVGVYDLQTIYAADGVSNSELKDAVWLDLDIAREEIKSIGHHVLQNKRNEVFEGHRLSLNPNLLRGMSVQQFPRKYPLATIHFVMWVTGQSAPGTPDDQYLFWLPDSCWITAQFEERFLPNVRDWITHWMPHPFLLETFERCQTESYEVGMADFLQRTAGRMALRPGRGQTKSRWRKLGGYQFRYKPLLEGVQAQAALNVLAEVTGWKVMTFPKNFRTIQGVKNRHQTDLSNFIEREEIFSYVIPNPGVINFTSFEEF